MKKQWRACLFFLGVIITLSMGMVPDISAQTADDILFMTEEFPPVNFIQDGEIKGISVDLMVLMLQKLGSQVSRDDFKLYPWARGFEIIQRKPNTCLFAMGRTPERENDFKWVGPIIWTRMVLMARKDRKLFIQSSDDINKYRIGVVIKDSAENILLKKGVRQETLYRMSGTDATNAIIRLLNLNGIDAWAYEEIAAKWILKKNGLNPEAYESAFVLKEGEQAYFAFHKDTSDSLIQNFQSVLDKLKAEGKYQDILAKYLK